MVTVCAVLVAWMKVTPAELLEDTLELRILDCEEASALLAAPELPVLAADVTAAEMVDVPCELDCAVPDFDLDNAPLCTETGFGDEVVLGEVLEAAEMAADETVVAGDDSEPLDIEVAGERGNAVRLPLLVVRKIEVSVEVKGMTLLEDSAEAVGSRSSAADPLLLAASSLPTLKNRENRALPKKRRSDCCPAGEWEQSSIN